MLGIVSGTDVAKNAAKGEDMETKKLFEKYHARVVRVGILKSLLLALIVGFTVMFIIAFISWAKEFSPFIALGVGLGLIVISMPLFYFLLFRPTTKGIVRLVDKLGLEERLITMYELEHDESYIAMLQREDAKAKLKTVNAKMMSFKLSKAVVISACVIGFLGLSVTVLSELSALGIIPPLREIAEEIKPEPPQIFDVIYEVRGSGFLIGEVSQKVEEGEDASRVLAVEDEGYYFAGWTWLDERGIQRSSEKPLRQDTDVKANLTVTAIFEPVENVDDLLSGMDGEGNKETPPRDPSDKDGGGGGGGDDGGGGDYGDPQPGPGGEADKWMNDTDNNTIIDGQTDYSSEFDYKGQTDELDDDTSLPPEIKDSISDYFDRIRP